MKKFLIAIALVATTYGLVEDKKLSLPSLADSLPASEQVLESAFEDRRSNVQVKGQGTVIRVLSDDNKGSRHQRFIIRLNSGQTLLVAHNIDIAPRIPSLKKGDTVAFYGEYEWNSQGGVIHWTHRDPNGQHVGGWLYHQGEKYQ